jgi:hypothetical protein
MKIKETCEKLGVPVSGDVYINPLVIAIDHEFKKKDDTSKLGYRERAVRRCIKNHVSFQSEFNTISELMSELISMKCPACGKVMKHNDHSGGNSCAWSSSWGCKCGVTVHLTVPNEGINVIFKEDK